MYVNDLDSGINSQVSKFVYDPMVGSILRIVQDVRELHGDLDMLCYEWVRKWQMEVTIGKCGIMSIRQNNPLHITAP